jgi:hypothetical protein
MKFPVKVSLGLVAAALLAACDNPDDPVPVQFDPVDPAASIRFFHAVPDAPDVDITVGDTLAAAGLEFGRATSFSDLASGTETVTVEANTPGGPVPVIGPAALAFDLTTDYTIIAAGEVDAAGLPIAPIVVANPESSVGAGNVRVEVVHAAAQVGAVDVYITAPGTDLATENAIAGGATPFGANSGQIEVPAGDYQIRITLANETEVRFDSGTVPLAAGSDLMVVAMDNTGPGDAPVVLTVSPGIASFQISDINTPAEIRVVHAVPDAPPVDVYINDPTAAGAPAIQNLAYTEIEPGANAYLAVPAGTYNLLVTAAGNTGVIAIPATDVDLAAGQQYTVYATGTLAGGISPFITEDDDRSIGTEARVRILHLAPSAGLVDIYVTDPAADITNLSPTFAGVDFLQETGYVSLAGDDYDVTVTLAGTKTAAIGPAPVTLVDGDVYTVAARDPDPNVVDDPFGVILLDDF